MELRKATLADAPAILAIYNREVLESAVTFDLVPRTIEEQYEFIRSRSGALAVFVAVTEETDQPEVTGFASLSQYRDRPGYKTSVEDSVYVHQDHQRKGVGDLLLGGVVEQATENGFHAIFARIADAQEASMQLHRNHGFDLVGIERQVGRKFGKWRDVALMQRML